MNDKQLGEQLAYDIIVIAQNHNVINEELWNRIYDVHGGDKDKLTNIDKRLVLEGAVEEFRNFFAEELDKAFDYNLEILLEN